MNLKGMKIYLEKKIQDLKQRCHGRFELMELYKKIDELEERLINISKPSSQQIVVKTV